MTLEENAMAVDGEEVSLDYYLEGASCPRESSEWERLAARLHPGVSVRLPLSRIPSKSYAHAKRAFDIVFSAGALVVLSPVLAACAVAVKATSPGPVLFKQKRWGTSISSEMVRASQRPGCLVRYSTMRTA